MVSLVAGITAGVVLDSEVTFQVDMPHIARILAVEVVAIDRTQPVAGEVDAGRSSVTG